MCIPRTLRQPRRAGRFLDRRAAYRARSGRWCGGLYERIAAIRQQRARWRDTAVISALAYACYDVNLRRPVRVFIRIDRLAIGILGPKLRRAEANIPVTVI